MSQGRAITQINLGGEGEVPNVINQQRPAVLSSGWGSAQSGLTLEQLAHQGHDFLICSNVALPIADDSIDLVITNSVPINIIQFGQPSVQTCELRRILATPGHWVHDNRVVMTKP